LNSLVWRRRLAGEFFDLHTAQNRRRDGGATKQRTPCLWFQVWLPESKHFSENSALLFGGFGDGGVHHFRPAAAKEKSQMPGAALAAAERPQEQEKQDGPLQDASPVRPQNILTSA